MVLKEMTADSFGAAALLFDIFDFHRPHFGSVLIGSIPGKVFADDLLHPSAAVIRPSDGFTYLACKSSPGPFLEAVHDLIFPMAGNGSRSEEPSGGCVEILQNQPALERGLPAFFAGRPFFTVERNVYDSPPSFDQSAAHAGKTSVRVVAGETKPHRVSFTAYDETGQVGSCSAWLYDGYAELDISVNEDKRRKGYAAGMALELCRTCLDMGYRPQWSCWSDNEASNALARSLGFVFARTVSVYIHDPE